MTRSSSCDSALKYSFDVSSRTAFSSLKSLKSYDVMYVVTAACWIADLEGKRQMSVSTLVEKKDVAVDFTHGPPRYSHTLFSLTHLNVWSSARILRAAS